jgi:hypothetical protein
VWVDRPYPHLVVEDALPPAIAATLLAEMPALEVLAQGLPLGSNQRFYLPSQKVAGDPRISIAWRRAMSEVNAAPQALLDWVISHLGGYILDAFPDFEDRFGPLRELRAVPRFQPGQRRGEVGVDAQIVVNSPPLADGTRVRGPHLDLPNKLISALLYLRPEDDDSTGGELELYQAIGDRLELDDHNDVAPEGVRLVRTYPYRHNLLVFPVSTPQSLHGVSPRARTARPRYQVHIVGEMAEPLFEIPRSGREAEAVRDR